VILALAGAKNAAIAEPSLARIWRKARSVPQVGMGMASAWQPLTPTAVDALPDGPAVFEVGSLVRTVMYIGGDANEGLRAGVRRALADPKLRLRARCVRWELTSDPRARASQLLAAYRAAHDGALPSEQPRVASTVRVFLPLTPETRAPSPAPDATAKRAVAPAASFLRVRTVA